MSPSLLFFFTPFFLVSISAECTVDGTLYSAFDEDGENTSQIVVGSEFYVECSGERMMMKTESQEAMLNYLEATCIGGVGDFVIGDSVVDSETELIKIKDYGCVEDQGACLVEDIPIGVVIANSTLFVKYTNGAKIGSKCEGSEGDYSVEILCNEMVWMRLEDDNETQLVGEDFVEAVCSRSQAMRTGSVMFWVVTCFFVMS